MALTGQMLAVAVVFSLLGATLWWLRRTGRAHFLLARGGPRPERRLELIERLALTPHHSLHLVRLADRAILVGHSPSGLTLLESFEWPVPGTASSIGKALPVFRPRAREAGE
jgi:flagellar biogenesis protein FliO